MPSFHRRFSFRLPSLAALAATLGVLAVMGAALQASHAAPQPAPVDLSSPKSAAKSLLHAVAAGDAAGVRSILLAENDQQEQLAGALADVLTAGDKLNDAAREKFGAAGDSIGKRTLTEEDAARIDAATVTNNGDNEVRMELPGLSKPMTWRKVNEQWRLLVMDYAGAKPDKIPEQISLLSAIGQAMTDTADDITAGKLVSSADAEASLQSRMNEVMIRAARAARGAAPATTTQPSASTTSPSTAPSN
jgi:hypothetical protein